MKMAKLFNGKSVTDHVLDSYDEAMGGGFNGRTMEECFNVCKANTEQLYKDGATYYDILCSLQAGMSMFGYPEGLGCLALLTLEPSNEEEMAAFGRKLYDELKKTYEEHKEEVME